MASPRDRDALAAAAAPLQQRIDAGELTYNEAWREAYAAEGPRGHEAEAFPHPGISTAAQRADQGLPLRKTLKAQHRRNFPGTIFSPCIAPTKRHRSASSGWWRKRAPDLVTADACRTLRALGCNQGADRHPEASPTTFSPPTARAITSARIADAMALLRRFGFKSHVHFMVNLLGADPASDIADYRRLVTDPAFSARWR